MANGNSIDYAELSDGHDDGDNGYVNYECPLVCKM